MDELEIEGRRYISTRRAAKEHKYTSDYVGQLIRGNKIIGKKVGRSWYVDEDSLNAYLSGEPAKPVVKVVAPVVEQPKPVERLVVEKVSPVVEPTTPIAQVSVEEKVVPATQPDEPVVDVEEKVFEPVIIKTTHTDEHRIPVRTAHNAADIQKPMGGLRYVADTEPALPEIQKKVAIAVPVQRVAAPAPQEDYAAYEEEYVEHVQSKKIKSLALVGVVFVGLVTLSVTALVSATLNSHIVVEKGQTASVGYSFK